MSMTVQTHPDRFEVRPYTGSPDPFVVVKAFEGGASASLFLRSADLCDALIAAAVEAKRLLDPPAHVECGAVDEGWHCTEAAGHAPADHLARVDVGGAVRHRWPAAPVITDSEPAQTYGLCPSDSPLGNYGCTLEPGHGGMHQSVEPLTGKARATWTAAS